MKLTPLDIHHKEFRRALRGYNEEEVDVFLDHVAEEFERVFKENIDSKEQVEKMQEKVKQYEGVEDTLQKALLTAQKAADEVQSNAQKESDLIIKDAELKAKEIIQHILTEKPMAISVVSQEAWILSAGCWHWKAAGLCTWRTLPEPVDFCGGLLYNKMK